MSAIIALALAASATPVDNEVRMSVGDDPQLNACLDSSGANDLAMRECWQLYAGREDDRLNHNWHVLMGKVGGSKTAAGEALLAEQQAWLAFRDASCQYYPTGTLDLISRQICYTERITARADELGRMVGSYEAFKLDMNIRTEE